MDTRQKNKENTFKEKFNEIFSQKASKTYTRPISRENGNYFVKREDIMKRRDTILRKRNMVKTKEDYREAKNAKRKKGEGGFSRKCLRPFFQEVST